MKSQPFQRGVLDTFDKHINAKPTETVFYKSFNDISGDKISKAEKEKLCNQAEEAIAKSVQPGMKRLREYIANDYLKNTRPNIGASSLPDGENFYKECIQFHTSTNLTAKEIHEIGLGEVARIENEMKEV